MPFNVYALRALEQLYDDNLCVYLVRRTHAHVFLRSLKAYENI